MDMFFRMKDVDRVAVSGKVKKNKKGKDEKAEKANEYINAYELRRKEQSDRRFQLLFLKRLENDGATITISKQDRELLRNFSKVEDEVAERDLKQAMEADGAP